MTLHRNLQAMTMEELLDYQKQITGALGELYRKTTPNSEPGRRNIERAFDLEDKRIELERAIRGSLHLGMRELSYMDRGTPLGIMADKIEEDGFPELAKVVRAFDPMLQTNPTTHE